MTGTIEINVDKNSVDCNSSFQDRYQSGCYIRNVEVVQESGKAIKIQRHVDSKSKDYSMWIPKKAFDRCPKDTEENGIERYMIAEWFEFEGFSSWFIRAN